MRSKGPLPRTRVLGAMRNMRRQTAEIVKLWKVTSTIHIRTDEPSGGHWEPRPADQYPENMEWAWADLYQRARKLRDEAEAIMALSSAEYHQLRAVANGDAK